MSRARLYSPNPRVTEREGGERLKPPATCQLCDQPTQIAFLAVREGARNRCGAPSDFMDKGVLRPDYVFLGWVTRCAHHYLRELYRMKRGVWNGINDDGMPTLDDYRRLHGDRAPVRGRADRAEQVDQARNVGMDQGDAARAGAADVGLGEDRPEGDPFGDDWGVEYSELHRDDAGADGGVEVAA